MCCLGGNLYSSFTEAVSFYGESDMRQKTAISLIAALLHVTSTSAQERRIKQSDLPAPVAQTAATESKGATVRGYAQETENGQAVYEVKLTVKGHTKDVQIDASGNVLEVEEQVDIDKLPNEVKSALVAKAGAGTIAKVESLTKRQKLVSLA
jgi:lipopolysaccharide export system protein LptA